MKPTQNNKAIKTPKLQALILEKKMTLPDISNQDLRRNVVSIFTEYHFIEMKESFGSTLHGR